MSALHSTGHSERLEQILDDFEEALQQGATPTLENYLPNEPTLRRSALVELVHAELEFRLKAGEPARVEEYLGRFPELAQDGEAVRGLIRAEYEQRRRREPGLSPDEYPERFPQFCDALPTIPGGPAKDGSALPSVPGYEVLDILGRGGMGVVYQARQINPPRPVALKMLLARAYATLEQKVRFRIEAEAVASLQHAHIVQLYEVGEHDGLPFFSLELCAGGGLDRKLKDKVLSVKEAAALVEKLARAMHYAHGRGVVHRDLKPANVLLLGGANTPVGQCEPKITDFGLAKRLDAETVVSQSGAIMGTPAYMAPEQAAGRARAIGPATDVYALGAILYELLAGRPPFRGVSVEETLEQVKDREPEPPSRYRPGTPRDLETICLKCLRKEPERRFASAGELADDLGRFLRGEPVQARPVGMAERLVKWVRRRPAAAGLLAAVLLLVLGGAVGGWWWTWQRAQQVRQRAELVRAVEGDLKEAADWLQAGNVPEAQTALVRAEGRVAGGGPADLLEQVRRMRDNLALVAELEDIAVRKADVKVSNKWAIAGAGPAYRAAFAGYFGKEWEGLGPPAAAEKVAASIIRRQLLAALDDWAAANQGGNTVRLKHLLTVAALADSDRKRRAIREHLLRGEGQALKQRASPSDVASLPPHTIIVLARALYEAREGQTAVAVLEEGQRRHPNDIWVNYWLGFYLDRALPKRREEAIGLLRVCVGLRPNSAGFRLELGRLLAAQGKFAAAEDSYREALRIKPDYAMAYNNLGNALRNQDRLPEALDACREAVRLEPGLALAHNSVGVILLAQGKLTEAEAACREAIRLRPKYQDAHGSLGTVLRSQKRWPEAEAAYRAASALKTDHQAVVYFNLAQLQAEQKKAPEAEAAYREAVRFNPHFAPAQEMLILLLATQNKLPEGVAACRAALRHRPDSAKVRAYLGLLLTRQGKMSEAEDSCREALEYNPNVAEAHLGLAVALCSQKRFPQAEAACHDALRTLPGGSPWYGLLYETLGLIQSQQQKWLDAETNYHKALKFDPKSGQLYRDLGLVLAVQKKDTVALKAYQESVRLSPDDAITHLNLGLLLRRQGQLAKAEAAYREATRLKPDYAEAHYNLGNVLIGQRKLGQAEAAYREAVRHKPDYYQAHCNLSNVLGEQQKLPEAEEVLRMALRYRPDDPLSHNNLGCVFLRQKKLDAAVLSFQEAIRLKPDYAKAYQNRGDAQLLQGKFADARASLRRAQNLEKDFSRKLQVAQMLRVVERCIALERDLPAILKGGARPKDNAERLALAQLCQQHKQLYMASARFYTAAFADQPKLAADLRQQHRYNAACAAALAGCGQGKDARNLPEKVALPLQRQALTWLRADLALYAKLAERDDPATKRTVRQRLEHWQKDADLAGVRDKEALANLPEAERKQWQQLWDGVAALLQRASKSG